MTAGVRLEDVLHKDVIIVDNENFLTGPGTNAVCGDVALAVITPETIAVDSDGADKAMSSGRSDLLRIFRALCGKKQMDEPTVFPSSVDVQITRAQL